MKSLAMSKRNGQWTMGRSGYELTNNVLGWVCFLVAAVTYMLTLEPTASFWDCPEFIAQGTKLEVGHPPGNPIFMLAARFFVNFAFGDASKAALMVNAMSGLLSAGCILLLFWTITHLVRRLTVADDATEVTLPQMLVVFGSGLCGALMYAWSDTFWFSAVEGEVYAFSSFCTALVFWLILKWENRADDPHSDRYLVLIAYIIGVSIAVHLLNLLCIPAIVLVIYYRKFKNTTATGSLVALAVSACIVALILYGLVPGFIKIARYFEIYCVNSLHLPYNTGVLVYALMFLAVMIWCIVALYRQRNPWLIKGLFVLSMTLSGIPFIGSGWLIPNMLLWGLVVYLLVAKKVSIRVLTVTALSVLVIFIGYSSYAMLLIRSHANPPMNQNAPDNVFALSSYLNREQYGETPLFYGPSFYSEPQRLYNPNTGDVTYRRGEPTTQWLKAVKTDPSQPDEYIKREQPGSYEYVPKMLFPRMYSTAGSHPSEYMSWAGFSDADVDRVSTPLIVEPDGTEVRSVEVQRPSMAQNLRYFMNYQLNHMYWRYFMWNFAGRQNDYAGNGELNRGNWISGIPAIDNARLGDQSLLPDEYGKGNKAHNVFFLLPLLMGIIGLCWQAFVSKRGIEQFWVVFFFFFMTGIAIVLYLNQPPMQPRERDYAFAGSFYAFAIWVGMGVAGLSALLHKVAEGRKAKADTPKAKTEAADADSPAPIALVPAVIAALVGLIVPLQVVSQTWDDHDRSGRYTTRDYGMNYLSSLDENAIIFTNGDNDTFPLWYAQEVEGFRPDVRVVNLMYLTTDWYANQMRIATDGGSAIDFMASPEDYAYNRLAFNYFMPDEENPGPVDARVALDDLYHSPDAGYQGVRLMRFPRVYIPSNIAAAVEAGLISEEEAAQAEDLIFSNLDADKDAPAAGITLSQALSLDMLATSAANNWNRPVYFAMTVPDEYYLNLGAYMRNTGLTYQVTPLLGYDQNSGDIKVNTDKMYRNVTERFRWGGLDEVPDGGSIYLDETVRRMVTTHRSALIGLAYALYDEGRAARADSVVGADTRAADRFAKAIDILNLMDEKLPVRLSPYSIQMGYKIADLNMLLGDATGNAEMRARGMEILEDEIVRYAKYLPYYNDLTRRMPGSGFASLSYIDRYVPRYIYSMLQVYVQEGGDTDRLYDRLDSMNINIDDLARYLSLGD